MITGSAAQEKSCTDLAATPAETPPAASRLDLRRAWLGLASVLRPLAAKILGSLAGSVSRLSASFYRNGSITESVGPRNQIARGLELEFYKL
jgi:hypothetical protein